MWPIFRLVFNNTITYEESKKQTHAEITMLNAILDFKEELENSEVKKVNKNHK